MASRHPCDFGGCDLVFEHPDVDEDCPTRGGFCTLMLDAGWHPIWLRVHARMNKKGEERWIFSRGGWLCPEHYADCRAQMAIARRKARKTKKQRV
jgi:hypothetical protein